MKLLNTFKIVTFFMCSLMIFSCKSTKNNTTNSLERKEDTRAEKKETIFYTEQVKNDFRAVSAATQKKFIADYKATSSEYNILFFTQGFTGEDIVIKLDKETLFKGSVLTNKNTGLAKNMRIKNTGDVTIYDKATKKTIQLNSSKAQKHKFIYIMKGNDTEEKPYKITYSDKLRPEK